MRGASGLVKQHDVGGEGCFVEGDRVLNHSQSRISVCHIEEPRHLEVTECWIHDHDPSGAITIEFRDDFDQRLCLENQFAALPGGL